jgi:gamma-glutamyltranspeptidase
MALRDGKPWMSFGTPGGEQQDQWQPLMLLRMLHHGLNIQEAIDMPAFHSEHWISSFWPRAAKPGKLVLEGRYPAAVAEDLKARGLTEVSEGAVVVPVARDDDKKPMPPLILVKSEGGVLYGTTDLATVIERVRSDAVT